MKSITKITAEEATKIYYESQKFKKEEIKKGKRVTLFNGILVGIITWGMLLMPNSTAYAKGSDQGELDLMTKGYSIKPKVSRHSLRSVGIPTARKRTSEHKSKPLQQFPKDVVNLATAWREIPKTTYYVGQEYGTAIGIAVGPIKGAASMVKNISKGH